jgi:hypothetical protein
LKYEVAELQTSSAAMMLLIFHIVGGLNCRMDMGNAWPDIKQLLRRCFGCAESRNSSDVVIRE